MSTDTSQSLPAGITRLPRRTDFDRAIHSITARFVALLSPNKVAALFDADTDETLAETLGLRCRPGTREQRDRQSPALSDAVLSEARRLSRLPLPPVEPLDSNLDALAERLSFSKLERTVLWLGALTARSDALRDLIDSPFFKRRLRDVLTKLLRTDRATTVRSLSDRGRLARLGLIETHEPNYVHMEPETAEALFDPDFQPATLLDDKLRAAAPPTLEAADFAHLPDFPRLRAHLQRSLEQARVGVNLLIYGPPGTGKTELARVLAAELGSSLFEVPVSDSDGEMREGGSRAAAYALCQRLLRPADRSLLLFDEVEDLFGTDGQHMLSEMFGLGRDRSRSTGKGWINEQLETNPIPTLWLCNDISAIDRAYLRRFDEIIELPAPNRSVRQRIAQRYLGGDLLSPATIARLAEIEDLPPAQIERVSRVVRSMDDSPQAERDTCALRLTENALRAMGLRDHLPAPELPSHYDPSVLNADSDLDDVIDSLRAGGRLLMHGPPGTGKTAFAQFVAQQLDRPVLVRRASDLLSKWVGGTEGNIAAAFRSAAADGAVLLIDEADSFLRERRGAEHSWEATQVNEVLTQMERSDGVFIASTNLVDDLDAATMRRFDFKVRFGYLNREQRLAMFERLCGDYAVEGETAAVTLVRDCARLTPGDFATVRRQLQRSGVRLDSSGIAARLLAEVGMKRGALRAPIGFICGRSTAID